MTIFLKKEGSRLAEGKQYVQCGVERIIAIVVGSEEANHLILSHLKLHPSHYDVTRGDSLLNFNLYVNAFRYKEVSEEAFNVQS